MANKRHWHFCFGISNQTHWTKYDLCCRFGTRKTFNQILLQFWFWPFWNKKWWRRPCVCVGIWLWRQDCAYKIWMWLRSKNSVLWYPFENKSKLLLFFPNVSGFVLDVWKMGQRYWWKIYKWYLWYVRPKWWTLFVCKLQAKGCKNLFQCTKVGKNIFQWQNCFDKSVWRQWVQRRYKQCWQK